MLKEYLLPKEIKYKLRFVYERQYFLDVNDIKSTFSMRLAISGPKSYNLKIIENPYNFRYLKVTASNTYNKQFDLK